MPAFPLDGGRVVRAILWGVLGDQRKATRAAAFTGQVIAWAMIGVGIAMIFGAQIPLLGRGIIGGIWLAFIGWFLMSAALRAVEQTRIDEMFEGVRVARLMRTRGTAIEPAMGLGDLVREVFVRSQERAVPVIHGGRFLGLIGAERVRAIPPAEWEQLTAGEVAAPAERMPTLTPDEPVASALTKLGQSNQEALPVVEGERLVGLLFPEDISRWIEFHRGRGTPIGARRPSWQG